METVYRGKTAVQYDKKRQKRKKWKREMHIIHEIVKQFNSGSTVLDVPFGTGRFFPIYEKMGHETFGLDISADMLKMSKTKMTPVRECPLVIGDIACIPMRSKTVDYAVCIRFLNWVTTPHAKDILSELHRVAKKGVIVGFRSQKDSSFIEMIKYALLGSLPTPRHIHRWVRMAHNLWRRALGKVKHIIQGERKKAKAEWSSPPKTRETRMFHNSEELMKKISELNMSVRSRFYVDSLIQYSRKKICPYSIFLLDVGDSEED